MAIAGKFGPMIIQDWRVSMPRSAATGTKDNVRLVVFDSVIWPGL
jgi:hypothetical protein